MIKPKQAIFPLYLPRGQREEDLVFLAAELRALSRQFSEFTGKHPSNEDLLATIKHEEMSDLILAKLYKNKRQMGMSNIDFYRLVRTREYLPAEQFSDLFEKTLQTSGEPLHGIPALLLEADHDDPRAYSEKQVASRLASFVEMLDN